MGNFVAEVAIEGVMMKVKFEVVRVQEMPYAVRCSIIGMEI